MKVHSSVIFAVLVTAATVVIAREGATDGTIISLAGTYSERELAAICRFENAAFYHASEGRYGCTNGESNVDCRADGRCVAFINEPFALIGAGSVEAGQVLRMPMRPASAGPMESVEQGADLTPE